MIDPIHAFYCSVAYRTLSYRLKAASGGRCAECDGIFDISDLRTHHIVELTLENINDPRITLNPENLRVICHDCHNKQHRRFGAGQKSVYVVWGAPCAGKADYVLQVATRYDLIVDLDRLHRAISNSTTFDKPEATKSLAFDLRDLLKDRIYHRAGKWESAYIVGCFPRRQERDAFVRDYGAELIQLDAGQDACVAEAFRREPRQAVREVLLGYIEDYFRQLTE